MKGEASVLGAFVRTHLEVIDGWDADLAHHVRALTDPGALERIVKAGRVAWVPLAAHVALTESLFTRAPGPARAICRKTVLDSFQQPFLHPLFRGAITLMGRSVARFARWTPAAWGVLFRDAGSLAWHVDGECVGRLVLADPAPVISESPAYVEGLAGAFSAFFDVARCEGDVSVVVDPRRIEFTLRWPVAPGP